MKRKFIVCSIIVLVLVVVAIILFDNYSGHYGKEYLEDIVITSDDGAHIIVVKEWGTVGGTGAEIYYLKDNLFGYKKIKIGETISKDSCYSFRDNNYIVEWNDTTVAISYFSGRQSQTIDNSDSWESKEFIFPQ
ncbi:MAG: hypothetical protein IKK26_06340 [Clostridia bacterium]|nr:hypothetical protein [Clostridia bacterium]